MDEQSIIDKTAGYIKEKLSGDCTGHDWWHVYRVWNNAVHIGRHEKADMFVVQLAALLHDISDWKFNDGNTEAGPAMARQWLEQMNVEEHVISHVCEIIRTVSFKGAGVKTPMRTAEGMIVQDADRLDAIGAVGIARAFAYGGSKNRELFNPDVKPEMHDTFEKYKNGTGSTINHFHEKLLLLKDLMNTETAARIAEKRHRFMEQFLERFSNEWDGKD